MDKDIFDRLIKLISQSMPIVDVSNVNESTRLIEDLRFDSLGLFTLVSSVEKEFNVSFKSYYHISTVQDVYDYIIKHLK